MRLTLLGEFELTTGELDMPLPLSAQRLLAFLALRPHRHRRHYVAGKLWLELSEERAAACLRSAAWRLRRTRLDLIDSKDGYIRIVPTLQVDFYEAQARIRRILRANDTPPYMTATDALLDDDLLPGWYDDWVVLERELFNQMRVHALERLAERLAAARKYAEAIDAAFEAIRIDPLRESAHRTLIGVHLAEGNLAHAIEGYHAYRRLLKRELGLAPSGEMRELVESVFRATG